MQTVVVNMASFASRSSASPPTNSAPPPTGCPLPNWICSRAMDGFVMNGLLLGPHGLLGLPFDLCPARDRPSRP
eukprot:2634299-Lingulodinium_polyedra.AAC.1